MDYSFLISSATLILNVVVIVAGAVWAVSKISSTTKELTGTVRHLNQSVQKLDEVVGKLALTQHNHETRITVLETLQKIREEV